IAVCSPGGESKLNRQKLPGSGAKWLLAPDAARQILFIKGQGRVCPDAPRWCSLYSEKSEEQGLYVLDGGRSDARGSCRLRPAGNSRLRCAEGSRGDEHGAAGRLAATRG